MPSADFCHPFTSPLDAASSRQSDRSPRVLRSHLLAYARRIYALSFPYRFRTLKIIALSSRLHASYTVSVRRASALPAASFRSHLAMDTLAVRLTIPPVGLVEDFHLLVRAPCRAHDKGPGRATARLGLLRWQELFAGRPALWVSRVAGLESRWVAGSKIPVFLVVALLALIALIFPDFSFFNSRTFGSAFAVIVGLGVDLVGLRCFINGFSFGVVPCGGVGALKWLV